MQAYRNMEPRYVEEALTLGRLKLSRISQFRQQEGGPLHEAMDGMYRYNGDIDLGTEHPAGVANARAIFDTVGVELADGVTFRGVDFVMPVPDHWALCLTTVGTGRAAEVYASGVKIPDVGRLAAEIARAHQDVLAGFQFREVSYTARAHNLNDGPLPDDPFFKDPKFAREKEIRIVWQARDDRPGPFFTSGARIASCLLPIVVPEGRDHRGRRVRPKKARPPRPGQELGFRRT